MTKPGWVTAVGIIAIVMACFGLLGSISQIASPVFLKMQKSMMGTIQAEMEKDIARQQESSENGTRNTPGPDQEKVLEMMETFWNMPDWYATWSVISGILQAIICAAILYASILLLQLKKSALKLFYWSAGAKIFMGILSIVVIATAHSVMVLFSSIGVGFSTVVFLVLLIVAITGDKTVFFHGQLPPPMPEEAPTAPTA